MNQRISEWLPQRADNQGLNVVVVPYEARADKAAVPVGPDGIVYRLKDAFSTYYGSWEVKPQKWGIPQWARDTYLKPVNDPYFCNPGGADHDIITACLDVDGKLVCGPNAAMRTVVWWSKSLELPPADNAEHSDLQPDAKGWAAAAMAGSGGSCYFPEKGQHGPYKLATTGASDMLWGFGMPGNFHVSFVVVFQAERGGQEAPVTNDPATNRPDIALARPLPANVGSVIRWFGENPEAYKGSGLAGHEGLDYQAPAGTPVLAAHAGVASVRNEGDYGLYVLLYNQQSGVTTMYSHLAKALVGNGQAVAAGQTVGTLAASGGGSKGTLHFGWQVRDVSNPAYGDWLDPMFGRMLNG